MENHKFNLFLLKRCFLKKASVVSGTPDCFSMTHLFLRDFLSQGNDTGWLLDVLSDVRL